MKRKIVSARIESPADLRTPAYMSPDASVELYVGDEQVAAYTPDEGFGMLRDVVLSGITDDDETAATVRDATENGELGVRVEDDYESMTDLSEHDLATYIEVEHDPAQQVMDHEYVDAACNHCGSEMEMTVAQPDTEDDLDVYMYDCDDCGNSGHYFGDQETEPGATTVWTTFEDTDSFYREIDIREGTQVTVYDLDTQKEVYSVDVANDWQTRPDGLLARLTDQPLPLDESTEDWLTAQREDPNFGVKLEDPTGGADVAFDENDQYLKLIDESQVVFGGTA